MYTPMYGSAFPVVVTQASTWELYDGLVMLCVYIYTYTHSCMHGCIHACLHIIITCTRGCLPIGGGPARKSSEARSRALWLAVAWAVRSARSTGRRECNGWMKLFPLASKYVENAYILRAPETAIWSLRVSKHHTGFFFFFSWWLGHQGSGILLVASRREGLGGLGVGGLGLIRLQDEARGSRSSQHYMSYVSMRYTSAILRIDIQDIRVHVNMILRLCSSLSLRSMSVGLTS